MPKTSLARFTIQSSVEKIDRPTISSWVLHALKIIMGDESIRQQILLHYHPELHKGNITKLKTVGNRQNHVKTFNAFIEPGKTREDKFQKIRNYLRTVITLKGTVVFTASNVQYDEDDVETHYQTFIVDNDAKKVYMIDPANDRTVDKNDAKYKKSKTILVSGQGIYYAQLAHEIVKTFFEQNTDYTVELVQLSSPAQIIENDVFCQSWSLYILDQLLENDAYKKSAVVKIPETQINKYDKILRFYQRIISEIPVLSEYLIAEYEGEITDCDDCPKDALLNVNPVDFLLGMTKTDMK
jgi:hypothetical protein